MTHNVCKHCGTVYITSKPLAECPKCSKPYGAEPEPCTCATHRLEQEPVDETA